MPSVRGQAAMRPCVESGYTTNSLSRLPLSRPPAHPPVFFFLCFCARTGWVEAAATTDGAAEREWQDDWDDEAADDNFIGRLREELAAHAPAGGAPAAAATAK